MARRFTRPRGRLGAPRRETEWLSFSPLIDSADGSAVLISSLNSAALALRPFTVVRTHLLVALTSDQSGASENQIGAVGLCVVSDQASAIGITAVPTPITDLASDLFFVHQSMINAFLFVTAAGIAPREDRQYVVDSKAMRKVNGDEDVVFTLEASGVGSGLSVVTMGRMLIKLH